MGPGRRQAGGEVPGTLQLEPFAQPALKLDVRDLGELRRRGLPPQRPAGPAAEALEPESEAGRECRGDRTAR